MVVERESWPDQSSRSCVAASARGSARALRRLPQATSQRVIDSPQRSSLATVCSLRPASEIDPLSDG